MKSQEAAIYREIQKSTRRAMTVIDTISDVIYDDQMAMQITRESIKYSAIHNQALDRLLAAREEPLTASGLADLRLKSNLRYNTLLNTSTGHIAELMIQESTQGITSMNRILNHSEETGTEAVTLAKELIAFEEKNIARMIPYL